MRRPVPQGQALADPPAPSLWSELPLSSPQLHLRRGHFGEDARKQRCLEPASPRARGFDALEARFESTRLQLSRAKIVVFLLSDVESWSFCMISDSKLFSKESWPFPLFSLPINFSSLLPLAALSSLRVFTEHRVIARGGVGLDSNAGFVVC